jgi:hypothetical protein
MKTLFVLITACLFFVSAKAQQVSQVQEPTGKYCVVMKDGVRKVTVDGMIITAEVVLSDSTRLTPDGTVIRGDGARAVLKVGECVGKTGDYQLNRNIKKEDE